MSKFILEECSNCEEHMAHTKTSPIQDIEGVEVLFTHHECRFCGHTLDVARDA